MNEKENKLKDMCDKAFKRNSIYPLMEIPKPNSKDTIEEQYKQSEIFPVWSDIDRIDASKIWKYKNENTENEMNEFIENRKDILDATIKKKENDNDNKDEIEKQLREQVKRLQEFINNKEKAAQ